MSKGTAFLGWTAGAAGIVLVYSAYKNVGPVSVIKGTLTGSTDRTAIDDGTAVAFTDRANEWLTGNGNGSDPAGSIDRARKLQARQIQPVWTPIPTQPTMKLDIYAVKSFLQVQAEYGKPLKLTGAQRSTETQAAGYAADPGRFAPPGKSGHEVGIAIDLDTSKVNVNDPRLNAIMTKYNWFAAGRSGAMHRSWGIPA
jgi:hypothetical protein